MKLLCLGGLAYFALLLVTRADVTIVQRIEGTGSTNKITMKIKGDRARVETGPQLTTLIDAKSGDLTTLLNDQKTVMRISGEKAKAMAEMAQSFLKDNSGASTVPKPTGKKETINGYETEEYITDSPKYHARYWIATTYPDYQTILKQMEVFQNGAFAAMRKGLHLDYRDLPGFPLRTKMKLQGQGEITSTIESVSQSPIADSEFSIPAGYTEMKMPEFLGGKKPSAGPEKPGDQ